MENIFSVKNGKLRYNGKVIGNNFFRPGFDKYIFFEEPLGEGANGATFKAKHKVLGVEQVIKVYFPQNGEDVLTKAQQEAIKNANTKLGNQIAVVFDAGEYKYPTHIGYSIMESLDNCYTLKKFREESREVFDLEKNKFSLEDNKCVAYIYHAMNIATGFLGAVLKMYRVNVGHGDLNAGNILWIREYNSLNKYLSHQYKALGELSTYKIKLIDLGSSKLNPDSNGGGIRDAWFIYSTVRSLLSPLFFKQKITFKECLTCEIIHEDIKEKYGVDGCLGWKKDNKVYVMEPRVVACELFRLVCFINILLGHINNSEGGVVRLERIDIKEIKALMSGATTDYSCVVDYEANDILNNDCAKYSNGNLINWEKLSSMPPFNAVDLSIVFEEINKEKYAAKQK